MRVVATAPGKLVVLGEYAVLEGAPALALAVNRRARVVLETTGRTTWEVVSPTLALEARLQVRGNQTQWLGDAPPELAWVAALLAAQSGGERSAACRMTLDSDPFYLDHDGKRVKLGLGSSAALTVALLGALHALDGRPRPRLVQCIAAHRAIQHGSGSGIDVAAALAGGVSLFQLVAGTAARKPLQLPEALHWCCVFSGHPASTTAMLAGMQRWRTNAASAYDRHMRQLATMSALGIDAAAGNDAAGFLSSLDGYAQALARLGDASGVAIVGAAHSSIGALAKACGTVYKSCGAGGGDVGITFAVEDTRLREFTRRACAAGFPVIGLETDPRGLEVATTV